jgi:hypothetical protein
MCATAVHAKPTARTATSSQSGIGSRFLPDSHGDIRRDWRKRDESVNGQTHRQQDERDGVQPDVDRREGVLEDDAEIG